MMSYHSVLLAQIFGLYFIITAIILLSKIPFFRDHIAKLTTDDFGLTLKAFYSLLAGIVLVDIHNMWVFEPPLGITLLAWFILIRAILWLAMPEQMLALLKRMMAGNGYYVVAIIIGLVGIYFAAIGYHGHNTEWGTLLSFIR